MLLMLRDAAPLRFVSADSFPSEPEPPEQLSNEPLLRFCFPFPLNWSSSDEAVDEEELKLLLDERRLAICVASCLLRSSLYLAIRRSAEFVVVETAISDESLLISSGGSSPLLGSLFCIFLTYWLPVTTFCKLQEEVRY